MKGGKAENMKMRKERKQKYMKIQKGSRREKMREQERTGEKMYKSGEIIQKKNENVK